MWGRGYFCGTVGEVDQKTIENYIEHQGEEDDDNFTVVEWQLLLVGLEQTFSLEKRSLDWQRLSVAIIGALAPKPTDFSR